MNHYAVTLLSGSILFVALALFAAGPSDRQHWPLASVTWQIIRSTSTTSVCDVISGSAPLEIAPGMQLQVWEGDELVDTVPVPASGVVHWVTPIPPGKSIIVRSRTIVTAMTQMLDAQAETVFGCWSDWETLSMPGGTNAPPSERVRVQ